MSHDTRAHAELSPSGASTWMLCPASRQAQRSFPNTSSHYARWGTAAHEIAERALREGRNAEDYVGEIVRVEGYDIPVEMDMAECVNDYVAEVNAMIDVELGDTLWVEQKVPLQHITGEEGATGTADAIGLSADGKRLIVIDLKTGQGVRVKAEGNKQGRLYAGGALKKFEAFFDDVEEVLIAIVQPRVPDGTTSELLTVKGLRDWLEDASIAAGMTELPDPPYNPGDDQCRWCRAKGVCPGLKAQVIEAVTGFDPSVFDAIDGTEPKKLAATVLPPSDMSSDKLAESYRSLALIEAWATGVRAEAERRLLDDQPVPGLKLVEGQRGNRKWIDEKQVLAELTRRGRLKKSEALETKLISPATAEKLLKPHPAIWSKIAPLYSQAPGKPSVVPESDPRPEYIISSTPKSFEGLGVDDTPALPDTPAKASILDD